MRRPFRRTRDGIAVRLDEQERRVVRLARDVVDGVGSGDDDPAAARLAYDARPDDEDASRRFRELTADDLAEARRLTDEEAESWMRVIGDARLALAARIGISEDGWEAGVAPGQPPELLLVSYLGGIQDALVQALMS
ncbi:MAG: DUF2017 family protein [Actinobacteria bacterium]|nr:DUF2017 family protein [Actinomycetota bacterium]NIS35698.1 DUF2017 family protein [Actinomycetota bacterium]NIT98278.1 DUF2017 family protein [Actinomycetota bacterium]NIU21904.1 DUF2017 family protein [Actinomycetota bacterium]NIU70338.1 DUF2017 family protein [Actinomycetota bacterium]